MLQNDSQIQSMDEYSPTTNFRSGCECNGVRLHDEIHLYVDIGTPTSWASGDSTSAHLVEQKIRNLAARVQSQVVLSELKRKPY